jgi:flagellar hook-length control protein FliK
MIQSLRSAVVALAFFQSALAFAADTDFPKTIEQYEATRTALVGDDLAAAKNGATNLADALKEEMGASKDVLDAAQKLASAATLKDARAQFQTISAELAKQVKGKKGFYIATCPMIKGSVWVQTTAQVGNPYAGKSMPECGNIKPQ